jgi:S1-C subfamily serine protease
MRGWIAALFLAAAAPLFAQEPPRKEIRSGGSDDLLTSIEALHQKAADRGAACVVAIKVDREPEPPPARRPATPPSTPRIPGLRVQEEVFAKRPAGAWCTGTVVEPEGVIVTTWFNVSGKVKSISVVLPDGREFEGKVLGYDGTVDLAVLKIEADGLPALKRAPLETLRAGQPLVALGRAPDGKGLTANPGIVSAASRMAGRGLQTDAKLNFGNVGGPLVDAEGRLVAVTCKVDAKPSIAATRGQNSGVGYAVTHDRLYKEILPRLKEGRNVAESRRPLLGIVSKVDGTGPGVELESVQPGGGAEKAGVKAGDVIIELEGQKIDTFDQLRSTILRHAPGDKVKVKVRRKDEELDFEVELGWDDRGE